MPRTTLAICSVAFLALSAQAQAVEKGSSDGSALVVVEGLAVDDLLNVRATASPTGMVIGRLPNGSTLRRFNCSEVNGHEWCKIASVDDQKLNGWTPSRYLQPAPEGLQAPDAVAAAEATGGAQPPATPATELPEVDPAAVDAQAAPKKAEAEMAAKLSGTPVSAASPSATQAGKTAPPPSDAPTDPATKVDDNLRAAIVPEQQPRPPADQDEVASLISTMALTPATPSGELGAPGDNAADASTPVTPTTPDGDVKLEASAPVQQVVLPESSRTASSATTDAESREIPCARYLGQPMTRCQAKAAKTGTDSTEVTVTLPDGGKRVIRFRDGKPEGSDSRGAFRFTREGTLSMIRIDTSERFEILDSVAAGE